MRFLATFRLPRRVAQARCSKLGFTGPARSMWMSKAGPRYALKTGQSESVDVDGNVTDFRITNNLIHDNDNIGIDAIGYEGVGPVGEAFAMMASDDS